MRAVRFNFYPFIARGYIQAFFAVGFGEQYGGIFATPAIAEKGRLDVRIDVASPGGHSSMPPAHTVRKLPLFPSSANFHRRVLAYLLLSLFTSNQTHMKFIG